MTRFSLDTNILVYAVDTTHQSKHDRAADLVVQAARSDSVLTQQVIGEFLNVSRKFTAKLHPFLRETAERYTRTFPIAQTLPAFLLPAFDRAGRFKLQFWDALIVGVCLANGVTHLLSEDLQDGQKIDGLTVIDPFMPANQATLDALLEEPG